MVRCGDLNADGTTDSTASEILVPGQTKVVKDIMQHPQMHTYMNATGGPSSGRAVEIRSGDYLPVSGAFFAKDHFVVLRYANSTTWSYYGGPFGCETEHLTVMPVTLIGYYGMGKLLYFLTNILKMRGRMDLQYRSWIFLPLPSRMILRAVVNDDNTGPHSSYQIGRVTAFQCNLDITEIIAFDSIISDTDAAFVEGYMAVKWGLISELPNSHDYKNTQLGLMFFLQWVNP